ncbi:dihydrolipoamide acetyltransferase family protein [Allosphingosinicella indica]|uniref:Dihydrolipoamide acetyltransferase component of pyruvate dehydrogenase complex n=1 Tax=Allosphingosinicella indica TaxID=941907 RepID=A0A1X7H0T7_9SPHN|nr:2-oxo acid dehydrogenase subunit E2 [Allosphingosinicella indica]SMF77817.1 2-oxoglutarate dehydrogenase E2 component (dihydrolipoamide succinyltransferase) [Allosphingosinicella indica]
MIDVVAPIEQEGTKAVVRTWLKQVGDRVEINDPLVELETDKVAVEVPAPAAGVLAEILLDSDAEAAPGAVLGRIDDASGSARPERSRGAPEPASETRPSTSLGTSEDVRSMRLSPSVKRALIQHDIDPSAIDGTGRDGRITRADVDRAVDQATRVQPEGPRTTAQPQVAPSDSGIASHSVPHDRMRLRIAENMLNSVTQAPHVTAMFECDFSAIIAHREAHKAALEKKGVKLTYTAYVVAAAAEAMKVAPAINSRWHDDRLELFGDINIGVGTALGEKGLIVPVLRQVQRLSLKGIAAGLDEMTRKARAEKLNSADVRGGTFTISNHGVSGSLFASPIIINQPQSAILGVGKLEKRVVVREAGGVDTIQIRPMAYVSLTIDHRVVDGHQTNLWLSRFVELIEGWPRDA